MLDFDALVPALAREPVGHDWWTVDLCFWPDAWEATAKCKTALDALEPQVRVTTMLLGFNLLLWTTHVTDEHFPLFGELKRAGFDGVELPIFEGDAEHFARIGRVVRDEGLRCTGVTVLPDAGAQRHQRRPAVRRARLERLKLGLRLPRGRRRRDAGRALLTSRSASSPASRRPRPSARHRSRSTRRPPTTRPGSASSSSSSPSTASSATS